MGQRISYGNIKTLMHFDEPFWNNATKYTNNYCMRDELGLSTWTLMVDTAGTGVDKVNMKWGWACLKFVSVNECIFGNGFGDLYNLDPSNQYEIDFFVNIATLQEQNIYRLSKDSVDKLLLKQTTDNKLQLSSSTWDFTIDGADVITDNSWNHILIRVKDSVISFYMNGILQGSHTIVTTDSLFVNEVYIGNYIGMLEEYCFKHEAKNDDPVVPVSPYCGNISISEYYGYGSGNLGAFSTTANTTNFNTYAAVTLFELNGSRITIDSVNSIIGDFGDFEVNDEIMIHVSYKKNTEESELFKYEIRKVVSIEGDVLILDKEIDSFTANSTTLTDYYVQVVKINCFTDLTVNHSIKTAGWNATAKCGGILALKCSNILSLLSGGYIDGTATGCAVRSDSIYLCPNDQHERLWQGPAAGIMFIMANVINTVTEKQIRYNLVGTEPDVYHAYLCLNGYGAYGFPNPSVNTNNRAASLLLLSNNLNSMLLDSVWGMGGSSSYIFPLPILIAGNLIPDEYLSRKTYNIHNLSIIDSLEVKGSAIQKPEYAFDFTTKTYVDSFYLMGNQPNNSVRKMIFYVDGVWNKFNEGVLEAVTTQTPTTDSILTEGNTVSEVAQLKNITAFVGKTVRVAVAMSLTDDSVPSPTLRIGVLAR